MFFLSLVLSLSRSRYLATSLSLSHTFSLIWQQNEPCRWKSFQHISRKLIYFHNKWDPLSWIHLYTSRCTKQETVSGPRLPLLYSPRLSVLVFSDGLVTHTYTFSLFFLIVWQNLPPLICNRGWLFCACVRRMCLVTISSSLLTLITVFGNNLGCWGGLHRNHRQPGPVAIDSWLGYWPGARRVGAEE